MYDAVALAGRGCGLVATSSIPAGTVVLQEDPVLVYTTHAARGAVCAACLRLVDAAQVSACACPDCDGQASFCNDQCRALAAVAGGSHPPATCAALRQLATTAQHLPDDQRDLLRFLVQAYALQAHEQHEGDGGGGGFVALTRLTPERPPPGCVEEAAAAVLHPLVAAALGGVAGDVRHTAALLRKDAENSYGIMAPYAAGGERSLRANAVYAVAARINHSCAPNVARFDYVDRPGPHNLRVYLRSLDRIEAGTEIVQSYFPLNLHRSERQQRTRDIYGFECDCWRCKHEAVRAVAKGEGGGDDDDAAMQSASESEEGEQGSGQGEEEESEWETDEEGDGLDGQLAVFLLKHLCPNEQCNGTLGPPTTTADHMECNFCGAARTDAEFFQMLEEL